MVKRGKKKVSKSKTSKLVDVNLDFDSSSNAQPMTESTERDTKDMKSTNKLLLDNFIALQDAMISIGANLKDLNQKITALLELFEKAAKNFEQEPSQTSLTKKLSTIIEQNQTIAKSLILMNKTLKALPQKTADLTEGEDFEGFKPSIKTKRSQKEETLTSDSSEESESTDSTSEGSEGEDSESSESTEDESGFKPEPLPDFNF